jgi:hypothetical protein
MHKERFGMKEEYEEFAKREDIEGRIKGILFLTFEEGYIKGFEAAN